MYSGLLPKGLTEEDLSPDDEEQTEGDNCESSAEKRSFVGGNTGYMVEEKSSHNVTDADCESATCSLPGISQEMWQKFQDLRKKKEEMKPTDVRRRRRKRRKHKKAGTDSEEPAETRELQEEEKPWDGLKQYFGVNDRFHPPACSKPPPKSGLEKSIEGAIAEGDIAKAEEMSDRLATREVRCADKRSLGCSRCDKSG
ncbi:protein FAM204A isoform X3 [Scomber scombrus]|uniref:Protein FAM204A isoform X3 n=1 Tax=Scomber scombrus TaxID=13677 RepID=A0AAV1NSJ1_SCOSC